ncbi:hypothetical protein ACFWG6_30895 [Streptomyces erythrochromogenes]|uniref:hypothetical protein n=1 Tax=Streptomyces erythrochromogenes TaxID=285574 RepID=UPI00362E0604
MQEPMPVVVQAGDKVLICLAEELTEEACSLISEQLTAYFDGVTLAILGGVRGVVVQREAQ